MKERPILMSAPMVRALLDGSKIQTRRAVKPQPPDWEWTRVKEYAEARGLTQRVGTDDYWIKPCPYGQVGDRLWVKETMWVDVRDKTNCVIYAATPEWHRYRIGGRAPEQSDPETTTEYLEAHKFWERKPSIFMPRWASRILVEITCVRVERLHGISEADAKAEGTNGWMPDGYAVAHNMTNNARIAYAALWTEINGAESWAANPWVWVLSFRRVKLCTT